LAVNLTGIRLQSCDCDPRALGKAAGREGLKWHSRRSGAARRVAWQLPDLALALRFTLAAAV
jgi:hypothetical protein